MIKTTLDTLEITSMSVLETITDLSQLGTLPTIPTLCFYCAMTEYHMYEHLSVLFETGQIEWITDDIVVCLPKPNWYLKWEQDSYSFGIRKV